MKCPKCGKENPSDYMFCDSCGSLLEKEKNDESDNTNNNTLIRCTKCGEMNFSSSRFCTRCGSLLTGEKEREEKIKQETRDDSFDVLKKSDNAIVGLILSIFSAFFGVICCIIPFFSQLIALVTGIIGCILSTKAIGSRRKNEAIWGIVLSTIGILFAVVFILLYIFALTNYPGNYQDFFDQFVNNPGVKNY